MLQRVYEEALPYLKGKKIKDLCIGIELLAVQLEGGEIGVAYVLKNEITCGCTSLRGAEVLDGMDAQKMASWMLKGNNPLDAALGVAVCNAAVDLVALSPKALDAGDVFDTRPDDVVGMIGNIRPIVRQLEPRVSRVIVFDRGDPTGVYPEEQQAELLPQCDLIVITSSSLLNGTFARVLSFCQQAREIVLTGATTPFYPESFRGTGVTVLAGCRWFPQYKEDIFTRIRQAACLSQIIKYGEKLTIRL